MRAYARPYSPHPNAQPDYTQRMTHYAHTPIPLNFMFETRFMSEKSSTSVTKRPQALTVSPVRVSTTIRSQPSLPACKPSLSRPKNGKNQAKILQYLYCIYTTTARSILYVYYSRHFSPFLAVSRHFPPSLHRSRFHQAPNPQVPDKPCRGDSVPHPFSFCAVSLPALSSVWKIHRAPSRLVLLSCGRPIGRWHFARYTCAKS